MFGIYSRTAAGLVMRLSIALLLAVIVSATAAHTVHAQDDGGGSGSQSSAPAASQEAQNGKYGAWTPIINVMKGCIMAAGGVGIVGGLAILATAGPRKDRHELGIYMLEGSSAGVVLALLVDPIYNLLQTLVVGI